MAQMSEGVYVAPDHARIAYRFREGSRPFILIHGLGCDASMWDDVVSRLPEDAGLLVPELRGHGGSTVGTAPPSVEEWARDVLALAASVKLARPVVAGLSMGGYTAFSIAALSPGFARAYAFIDTAAAADAPEKLEGRAQGIETLKEKGLEAFAEGLLPLLLNTEGPNYKAHFDNMLRMCRRAGTVGLATALLALANRPDRTRLRGDISEPCMVVVGDADQVTPVETARSIVRGLSMGKLQIVKGAGHMTPLEAPAEVARALVEVSRAAE